MINNIEGQNLSTNYEEIPPIISQPLSLVSRITHSIHKLLSNLPFFRSEETSQIPPTTIASLDREIMAKILCSMPPTDYAQVCKSFHFHATEQAKALALKLCQMDKDTGLLRAFGLVIPQNFETTADFFDLINSTKELVKKLNQNLPKGLRYTCSTFELLSGSTKIKSFLQDIYNLSTFLALMHDEVHNSDSLRKVAKTFRKSFILDKTAHWLGPSEPLRKYFRIEFAFFHLSDIRHSFPNAAHKLHDLHQDLWKLTNPDPDNHNLLPTQIKELLKRANPARTSAIDRWF